MRILSAHQINFCPWRAFFQKIEQCDIFILMANTQFRKGGYESRFKVGNKWYGMSVNRGLEPLINKRYVNINKDWLRLTKSFPVLKVFDSEFVHFEDKLHIINTSILFHALDLFGIKTIIDVDYPTQLTGTARLVDICKTHNATHYLSGISGRNYLDLSLFDAAGIEVIFQDENKMDKRPLVECL